MATLTSRSRATDITQALAILAEKISENLSALTDSNESLLRLSVELERSPQPLEWLSSVSATEKTYWSDRAGNFEMAGVWQADQISCSDCGSYLKLVDKVKSKLSEDFPMARYYGGLGFTSSSNSAVWEKFGTARLTISRFELLKKDNCAELVCNLFPARDVENKDKVLAQLEQLSCQTENSLPAKPLSRIDNPNFQTWAENVNAVLKAIENHELEKVVLARESLITFDKEINPTGLLSRLKKNSPGCFHFCFQADDQSAFIGATPEMLYTRDDRVIQSEAIAGTQRRGEDEAEDNKLEDHLKSSDKERREQSFVAKSISTALFSLCEKVSNGGKVDIIKLARVQHLVSRFEGRLKNSVNDADILRTLHPTPAVGGYPTELAIDKIKSLEKFQRGWYAGPVGWIGLDKAEFAVGIRSALVNGQKLMLFSGAGIVAGSVPTDEWEELESKISNFLGVIDRHES